MCRLFGFRSVLRSQVHRSLRSADNALAVQSRAHPDGWGVAYYVAGVPHVIKSTGTAGSDHLFERVSGLLTSETVIAHVRRATQGGLSTLNCHPFQHGRWILAHNGDVPGFGDMRQALLSEVSPAFRKFILGDTDSELIFHLFLSRLAARVDLHRRGTPLEDVVAALRETVATVRGIADRPEGRSLLTLMVTDGDLLVAHQGGRELRFSTWKRRCPERSTCSYFAPACEAPVASGGYVNHLVISSEPLHGENEWTPLEEGEIVAVDPFMRFSWFQNQRQANTGCS
jgi:glutamine amidotransferase